MLAEHDVGRAAMGDEWCECARETIPRPGAMEHDQGCGYPKTPCSDRSHAQVWHHYGRSQTGDEDRGIPGCGKPIRMLFCQCGDQSGWTFDPIREWWVDAECGWPTERWYEGAGRPKVEESVWGHRPRTWYFAQGGGRGSRPVRDKVGCQGWPPLPEEADGRYQPRH